MIVYLLSRLVILVFGTIYPAYYSYKTVRNKDVKGYVQWMKYWIVFAFLSFLEPFCDFVFSSWMPFYYETKILLVAWLLCPVTRGYNCVFRTVIHPALREHEELIDDLLEDFNEKCQKTFLEIGRRGSSLMFDTMARALYARTGYMFAYTQELPSRPPVDMISFFNASENRAIQYHPALTRTLVESRTRRQSDPTHFNAQSGDISSQNRRTTRLRRAGNGTSIETVHFATENTPFSSSSAELSSSTETLNSYPDSGAYRSLERLDDRILHLAPVLNERLDFLARKLALEGLTDRDISTVMLTLLSGMEHHPSVPSKETEAKTENLERLSPDPLIETETKKEFSADTDVCDGCDVFSDASEGLPGTDQHNHPSPNKDGSSTKSGDMEEDKGDVSNDLKAMSRAGRYRKRPAPNPPDSKNAIPM